MTEHVGRYDEHVSRLREWDSELAEPGAAGWLLTVLDRGQASLHLNLAYVTAFLRYFDYEDEPDDAHVDRARVALAALEEELASFRVRDFGDIPENAEQCLRNVQGVDVFISLARSGLTDLPTLRARLTEAPDSRGVIRLLDEARERDRRLIAESPGADESVRVAWFRGRTRRRPVPPERETARIRAPSWGISSERTRAGGRKGV